MPVESPARGELFNLAFQATTALDPEGPAYEKASLVEARRELGLDLRDDLTTSLPVLRAGSRARLRPFPAARRPRRRAQVTPAAVQGAGMREGLGEGLVPAATRTSADVPMTFPSPSSASTMT